MEKSMRDNLEWGEGNLANRVDDKDLIPLADDHHSSHQKQIVWNCRVLHQDLQKMSQQFLNL